MFLKYVAVVLVISLIVIGNRYRTEAQTLTLEQEKTALPTRLIKDVSLEGQLPDVLGRLSLNYDIPLGLEISPDEQLSRRYRVELKEGTVTDLMNQIITQNLQYNWSFENGVVNLFPRDKYRDKFLTKLLNVRIEKFAIRKNTDCWTLQKDLVEIPEVREMMDAYRVQPIGINFTGFHIPQLGRNFSLGASDTTLKALLNQIVKESPLARTWIISIDNSSRTLNLGVNSRQSDKSL